MEDLNSVTLVGRLTRDAEMKYSQAGNAYAQFSVANNKRKAVGNGEYEDAVSFFDCVMFGKLAESLTQYLVKGKQICLQGRMNQDRWEDAEGGKRSKIGIEVWKIQMVGGKADA